MHSKIPLYEEYHAIEGKYPGNSYKHQHPDIAQCVVKYGATSMLDYGCGKGNQWTNSQFWKEWGFMPHLYDPAVPQYNKLPTQTFDAIISTDVFEHIPEAEIPGVLYWMFLHANKFIFLGIANTPAKAILPNGENAHCTLKSHKEWEKLIRSCATKQIDVILKTYPDKRQKSIITDFAITNATD